MSTPEPHATGTVTTDDGAEIWWEASGAPDGRPLVWLHGGPGGGLGSGGYRRGPDLAVWRVVGLDQRACGRSRPLLDEPGFDLASLTTQRMVEDLEQLRVHLGIERWLVAGGSWGATLALAYAEAHPDRVTGLVLYAVTTTSRRELDWISEGVGRIYPEAFAALDAASGRRPGQRVLEAYLERLTDPDPAVRRAAATAWCTWEDAHVAIGHRALGVPVGGFLGRDPDEQVRIATHVVHSWAHDGFLGPSGVLDGLETIAHLPLAMVHGRLDVSAPVETAWEVHRRVPGSRLVVVEDEGHGGPQMSAALASAYAEMETWALDAPTAPPGE